MNRTLLATAFLTLMMPTMSSADDADVAKQVGAIEKQHREAVAKNDLKTATLMLADDWVGINPLGEVADKAKAVNSTVTVSRISNPQLVSGPARRGGNFPVALCQW